MFLKLTDDESINITAIEQYIVHSRVKGSEHCTLYFLSGREIVLGDERAKAFIDWLNEVERQSRMAQSGLAIVPQPGRG